MKNLTEKEELLKWKKVVKFLFLIPVKVFLFLSIKIKKHFGLFLCISFVVFCATFSYIKFKGYLMEECHKEHYESQIRRLENKKKRYNECYNQCPYSKCYKENVYICRDECNESFECALACHKKEDIRRKCHTCHHKECMKRGESIWDDWNDLDYAQSYEKCHRCPHHSGCLREVEEICKSECRTYDSCLDACGDKKRKCRNCKSTDAYLTCENILKNISFLTMNMSQRKCIASCKNIYDEKNDNNIVFDKLYCERKSFYRLLDDMTSVDFIYLR